MKNLITSFFCLLCVVTYTSCGNNKNTEYPISSVKQIQFSKLDLDAVYVPMDIETCSYNGFSGVDGEHLYFWDQFFCFLYEISPSGLVLNRHIGLGNGPNEIHFRHNSGITVVNNELLIMGNTYDVYLFEDFRNREIIRLKITGSDNSLNGSKAYTSTSEILLKRGDKYFYNIYSEADYCNPWEHSIEYFTNAHILMEVDLKSGEEKPVGKYSRYYLENHKKVNHLFQISYDIDGENNFYVSYQADSLIYQYDKKFATLKVFGFKGLNMDTNYTSTLPNLDEFLRAWAYDIPNKGYYNWIKHIDETKMTFRSYQKGSHTDVDGLQIYQDGVLIADVEVPKHFKVAGYIPPYYISQIICDEEAETMKFYKFRLD